jgi:Calpain family cysteine protease
MKAIPLLASLLLAARLTGAQPERLARLEVSNAMGSQVYSNVVITSVTATHVYFTHSFGLGSAKLKDLGADLRKHFHFDPIKAEAVQEQQIEANNLFQKEFAEWAARQPRVPETCRTEEDNRPHTEPSGEVSPNPPPMSKDEGLTLKNFAGRPLFAKDGPSKDDIFEGKVGDCYLLATLAALAESNPDFIRQTVTDLNDGTYDVRFFQPNGSRTYVRVTPEFWVDEHGRPKYARFGRQGCLWVPLLEKAFAVCRRNPAGYDSIEGGGGRDLNRIVWKYQFMVMDGAGINLNDVVSWSNEGEPDGAIKDSVQQRTTRFLKEVNTLRQDGKAMVLGGPGELSNTTPLVLPSAGAEKSTYHGGQHLYMVDHVEMDGDGNCAGIVLRDPWGTYRKITDLGRIFFCTGGAAEVVP